MEKKIYLTGRVADVGSDLLNQFQLAVQELNALGFKKVSSPIDVLIEGDLRADKEAEAIFLKKREELRQAASVVLHLNEYEYDIDAIQEVKRSKHEGKEVYSCLDFIKKHSEAKIS